MGQLLCGIPVLPSSDFDRTAAFFTKLGFRHVARFPAYLILRRGGAELHFRPAQTHELDPSNSHFTAYIRVLNTRSLEAEWESLNLPATGPGSLRKRFVKREWGMTEAYACDPDGALITFGAGTAEPS
ncbi:MAG: VOC family protein [Myxococcota bacterium]